ncbi:Glutathione S-transferase [Aliiroseovarius sediminilitoris]|uniref:Glutathione S-transferase n=1 Tax=Aliiroseovarius sediminilitoris TaxID=1173584 RepID=A0A1I0MPN2_9RHOB|nr:glutathione S-transferase [Aliiroseovarius sediminilitoris]SEV90446.1 Glutathione S-transferase [Aliiroseovarius sediminilitoris]
MLPILYSFRRCPYAIRARLAIASSGVQVELREILLRDKPQAFLDASPTATVPCLVTAKGVLDESYDIMRWALAQNDPEGLCDMPDAGFDLIESFDGPFKRALDLTKYAVRHPDSDPEVTRAEAMAMLTGLEAQLANGWLYGRTPTLADFATLPFVRQFAMIDKPRFDTQATPRISAWLETFLASDRLADVMQKYPPWQTGDTPTVFR